MKENYISRKLIRQCQNVKEFVFGILAAPQRQTVHAEASRCRRSLFFLFFFRKLNKAKRYDIDFANETDSNWYNLKKNTENVHRQFCLQKLARRNILFGMYLLKNFFDIYWYICHCYRSTVFKQSVIVWHYLHEILRRNKERIKIEFQDGEERFFLRSRAKVKAEDCSENYFSKVTSPFIEAGRRFQSEAYIIIVNDTGNVIKTTSVKLRPTYLYAFLRYCSVAFLGEVLPGVIIVYRGYAVVWISS